MKQDPAHGGTKHEIGIGIVVMRCGFSRAVWCLISFEELKFLPSDSSAMYRSGHDSRPRGIYSVRQPRVRSTLAQRARSPV